MQDQRSKNALLIAFNFDNLNRAKYSNNAFAAMNEAVRASMENESIENSIAECVARAAYSASFTVRFNNCDAARISMDAAFATAYALAVSTARNDTSEQYQKIKSESLKKSADICREVFGEELIDLIKKS